jgi:hypothetical protein
VTLALLAATLNTLLLLLLLLVTLMMQMDLSGGEGAKLVVLLGVLCKEVTSIEISDCTITCDLLPAVSKMWPALAELVVFVEADDDAFSNEPVPRFQKGRCTWASSPPAGCSSLSSPASHACALVQALLAVKLKCMISARSAVYRAL